MKKLLYLILAFALLLSGCNSRKFSEDFPEGFTKNSSGNFAENFFELRRGSEGLSYTFDDTTGGYTLIGIGSCTDEDIVIPQIYEGKSVTSIEDNAFENVEFIKSIDIPNTITKINVASFASCPNLEKIIIPNSLTDIEPYRNRAFGYLTGSTHMTFADLSDYADLNLSYNVYENIRYLGSKTNPYHALIAPIDYSLSTYAIHPDTKLIASCAFNDCKNLSQISIPNGVTIIGAGSFECHNKLTDITIPDSVTRIDHHAFAECDYLTNITLGKGITNIGENAFSSSVTNIYFYGDAPTFDADAFGGLTTTIYYDINNPTWTEQVKKDYNGTITWKGVKY